MQQKITKIGVALVLTLATPAVAGAQAEGPRFMIEARGGLNVPTFDITDAAEAGPSFGAGIGYRITDRFSLLAEGDFGFHPGASVAGVAGPDVSVYHMIGKVGYEFIPRGTSPWSVMVNAGAGALLFDVDVAGFDPETYFAINVGAKIGYRITPNLEFVLSPQGDIAFTDAAVLGTDNSWVWPFAVGGRVSF